MPLPSTRSPGTHEGARHLAIGCAGVFALLTAFVTLGPARQLDEWAAVAVFGARSPLLTAIATPLTRLGSAAVTAGATVVLALYLGRLGRKRMAVAAILAWVATWALANLTKIATHRARPRREDWLTQPWGDSYPSQHAALIACVAVLLVRFLPPTSGSRRVLVSSALVLVLLVAATRVYLGVHHASDVAAGVLLGTAVASFASTL